MASEIVQTCNPKTDGVGAHNLLVTAAAAALVTATETDQELLLVYPQRARHASAFTLSQV